ncbi:MAG: P-II family nitrogen regulator [Clostridiales bacterium]|jgi:nitrogen regulatory protein PII|nr:P-II family nitrogen regulator [Clostridiales bacterium]
MANMQLLVLVLNRYEKLDKLLTALDKSGIKGATVINSTGMARLLNTESLPILGSIRTFLNPEREDNRTIFIVACEEKIKRSIEVIHDVLGSLDRPDTGVIFVIPTLYTEGISNT